MEAVACCLLPLFLKDNLAIATLSSKEVPVDSLLAIYENAPVMNWALLGILSKQTLVQASRRGYYTGQWLKYKLVNQISDYGNT